MFDGFRCYSDELVGKSPEELRKIFANYSDPSCTPLGTTIDIHDIHTKQPYTLTASFLYRSDDEPEHKTCQRWIYNLDYGYQSMTTDVCEKQLHIIIQLK